MIKTGLVLVLYLGLIQEYGMQNLCCIVVSLNSSEMMLLDIKQKLGLCPIMTGSSFVTPLAAALAICSANFASRLDA
jgi:hypothetical protein